ncbi:hypothetical protein F5148DRAFT_1009999 [Russula earlei]|uniref:Uncharacterized protein n=1 Tax=Russula earlei TaxID=71964 RepID=A0ACC0UJ70_9AGAM|nr:hypothetical protein F5148DRAFT_1009999 [Russula earlei]
MPVRACLKYAEGADEVDALRREATLYGRELAALAGVAVPRTYGLYVGGTEAVPIACLVMELCVGAEVRRSADELGRLAILALCKVHAVGVMHNTPLDLRHFVMKGKKVFLVDFALAVVHRCENAHPVLWDKNFSPVVAAPHDLAECTELVEAERNIFSQVGENLPMKISPSFVRLQ